MADSVTLALAVDTSDPSTTSWYNYATMTVGSADGSGASQDATSGVYLRCTTNASSAVPSGAAISGVEITVWGRNGSFSGGTLRAGPNGTVSSVTAQAFTVYGSGTQSRVFGGPTDALGATSVSDLARIAVFAQTGQWVLIDAVFVKVYYTVGPPDPNAPVTTKLYPNGVKDVGSFSNAANLVGSSQTAATNTLSLEAVASIYTDLLLNFSTIPAGAVISTVVAKVKAKTSASNTRRLANVLADAYYTTGGGSSKAFDLGSVQLTTTETTYSKSLTWAELTATIPEAKLRDANMVFVISVLGNDSTTTTATTTISGFWLEVTYTLPSGGVNALFLGECF